MSGSFRKITQLLDGQPRTTGKSGQSLVEMALVAPLLIMMVLGLVEIGFLANDYMILLDAVRAGGRTAVNLDPLSFPAWNITSPSVNQWDGARNQQRMDCDKTDDWMVLLPGTDNTGAYGTRQHYNVVPSDPSDPVGTGPGSGIKENPRGSPPGFDLTDDPYYYYSGNEANFGFFDEVACQVTLNMQAVVYDDDDSKSQDDIVISAVSYARMEFKNPDGTMKFGAKGPAYNISPGPADHGDTWITVTGRYPLENRFCGYSDPSGNWVSGDFRDPFNYKTGDFVVGWNTNSAADGLTADTNEGISYKSDGSLESDPTKHYVLDIAQADPMATGVSSHNQGIRGFIFGGHHVNFVASGTDADNCFGSAFRVQDIEKRLNLDSTWNPHVPNGGLVIVEVFWQYHPLYFGPLFQGFTNDKKHDPIIHVWGWFLVPSIEPTETPSS